MASGSYEFTTWLEEGQIHHGMEEEEEAIRYYFRRSYDYNAILEFLDKYHDIRMSKRTLLNRLRDYGLNRRNRNVDEDLLRDHINRELQGSGNLLGYRAMWRRLHLKYDINVPRSAVEELMREIDPEGVRSRKAHRLKRRKYSNPGRNYCWHVDGYDKLKPYGLPIHRCIDGFSRRLIWLKVEKSNNDPRVIANLFKNAIIEIEGCPTLLRTDRGTENSIVSSAQCFFRRNGTDSLAGLKAQRFGSSHSNQRIEAWWAFLRRTWSTWWMNFFKDMIHEGHLDASNKLHLECIWFCFKNLIQNELNGVMEEWNNHYIRKSRFQTASGIPNNLFFLPESVGATDRKHPYNREDIEEINNELRIPENDDSLIYQEYFSYVSQIIRLGEPSSAREALTLYCRLLVAAQ